MHSIPLIILNLGGLATAAILWVLYISPQIRDGDNLNRFARKPPTTCDEWSTLTDAYYRGLYSYSQTWFGFRIGFGYCEVKYWFLHQLVFAYAITAWLFMTKFHWLVATVLAAAGVIALTSYWYRYRAVRNYPGPVHPPYDPENKRPHNLAAH